MNEHLGGKINPLTRLNLKRRNWEPQLLLIDTQAILCKKVYYGQQSCLINLRRTSDWEGGEERGGGGG